MKIHFILSGGTINKVYNPVTEKPEMSDDPIIASYLRDVVRPHGAMSFETVCLKDSLEITNSDRAKILRAVTKSKIKHIVIVHGTSTMTQTLKYLERKTGDKTVILTGAMIPLKEFAMSDGGFNLGFAIGAMKGLKPGVYLCMNGRVFKPGEARKDVKKARFVKA